VGLGGPGEILSLSGPLTNTLRRNIEASRHKHFVVVSRHQKLQRLPATSVINSPRSVAAEGIALDGGTVHSTHWSQILADKRDLCLHHLHSTPRVRGVPVGILP